ncbi:MAG: ArsA family ATPase [Gemmatimonadota bacterium]|nr:MAG: ArsA family ATPase [Gemmatimonadota bacterium]
MKQLFEREIVFFGGKGGVGKTTLAASFALRAAERGERTLLVSTDPAHSTSDILETELGPEPRQVVTDFWAVELDPEQEAAHYIDEVKQRITETTAPQILAEVERQIDIARISPGSQEAALFERFTQIIEGSAGVYQRIVFDTAPTGQTLRLLSLPELLNAWIGGLIGRRKKLNALSRMWRNVAGVAAGSRSHSPDPVLTALEERQARIRRSRQILTDARKTAFAFVVIPERLPILETERAVAVLTKYHIPVGAVFVNRVLPPNLPGEFLAQRSVRESRYLESIERTLGRFPTYRVPLSDADVVGVTALRQLHIAKVTRRGRE